MSQSAAVNTEQKSGIAQSAEGVVAIALFAVCATAGLAAWLLSGGDADSSAPPAAVVEVSAGLEAGGQEDDELAVLSDWQQRIDSEFDQRDQARRQQAQSQAMQQQAEALAAAQAAANAAQEAAAAAEARLARPSASGSGLWKRRAANSRLPRRRLSQSPPLSSRQRQLAGLRWPQLNGCLPRSIGNPAGDRSIPRRRYASVRRAR